MFQFMSHSVRSIDGLEVEVAAGVAERVGGSGAIQVPVAVTGRVMPLIVSSPSTLAVPSSPSVDVVEVKVTSGWLAASKNSSPRTWARNCSGVRIEIDSTLAAPSRRPSASVAVDLVERALEERDALVADGEAEARVDGIGGVGAGELGGGGHGVFPLWSR